MRLFLDLETYGARPITHGTHAYAEAAEVIITAWATDDGPVSVADGWPAEAEGLALVADEIVIHSSRFDRTVLRHAQGVELPVERIVDTVAMARAHGLPGSLGTLCQILNVPTDKAKSHAGKQLIQLFCKPRGAKPRATAASHPAEWQRFREYAGLDIEAMREVLKRLPRWNYPVLEGPLWQLDQRINDRGFAVDLDLARGAIAAVQREQARLSTRTAELTGGEVEAATQVDKLLAHLLGFHGVELPDCTKDTLTRRLEDENLPAVVRELIAIRLETATTSTAKYKRLADAASADGRLRGTLEWCGAARTGRWAGRLFQPQNLPRPSLKQAEIDEGIVAMKAGCADLVSPHVMRLASSALRGCIVAPAGRKLVVSDLSNIEGRALAWLAGEDWKLEAFSNFDRGEGHDLYKLAYARSFGVPPEEVDGEQRQLGKVQELALGYQGAVGAFQTMAAIYGVDLPEPTVIQLVRAWRRAHPATTALWYELEAACLNAVAVAEQTFTAGRLKVRRDGAWLRLGLPSGRVLCYPQPKVEPTVCHECTGTGEIANDDGEIEPCDRCRGTGRLKAALHYSGTNPYTRRWSRIATYGGKLVENATQAVARDVMAANMPQAEAEGYEIVLTVHDELLTETPDRPSYCRERLSAILATQPAWAKGLPLAAGGFEAHRYRKG